MFENVLFVIPPGEGGKQHIGDYLGFKSQESDNEVTPFLRYSFGGATQQQQQQINRLPMLLIVPIIA